MVVACGGLGIPCYCLLVEILMGFYFSGFIVLLFVLLPYLDLIGYLLTLGLLLTMLCVMRIDLFRSFIATFALLDVVDLFTRRG